MSGELRAKLIELGAKPLGRSESFDSPLFGEARTCEVLLLEDGSAFIAIGEWNAFSLLSRLGEDLGIHTRVLPGSTKTGSFGYSGDTGDRTYQSLYSDDAAGAIADHRTFVASVAAKRALAPSVLTRIAEFDALREKAAKEGRAGCRELLAVTVAGTGITIAVVAATAPLLVTILAAMPIALFWALWITPWLLGRIHRRKK